MNRWITRLALAGYGAALAARGLEPGALVASAARATGDSQPASPNICASATEPKPMPVRASNSRRENARVSRSAVEGGP